MPPTDVLVTVMTYPLPSRKYQEVICTAGLTRENEWVRLYPIDYRYRPHNQQFRKFQWINLELGDRGSGNDNRKESRKPNLETIRMQGEPLKGWEAKRKIIDVLPHSTLLQLRAQYEQDKTSLGVIRPTRVEDVLIERNNDEWKPEWQALFNQLTLFGPPQKPLRRIPFKFSFEFECEDSSRTHRAMIEDWELGVLFLKESARLGSDEAAAESVRNKYLNELCASDRDTRFFLGTTFPWNTWVVVGVFWPPAVAKQDSAQLTLI